MSTITAKFVYCERVVFDPSSNPPKSGIQNVLPVISPIAIPSNYTFTISCSIFGLDSSRTNRIRIFFHLKDDESIDVLDTKEIQIPEVQNTLSEGNTLSRPVQFNLEMFNFAFKQKGMHVTELFVNGEKIEEAEIEVVLPK